MTRHVWVDGRTAPWPEPGGFLSHGMQRGALVFDVGALRAGSRGPVLFRPREHIARFLRSASLVGLELPWDQEQLLGGTLALARARPVASALVRWSAFVPTLEPDVVPRRESRPQVVIAVIAPEDAYPGGTPPPPKSAVRVMVPADLRKAGPEVFPPQAKVSASYLGPMLAKRRALAAGFDEVVLLDGRGNVAEAPTANVFVVRGGELWTPPTDRVLAGITRDTVLAIARAEGVPAREEPFTATEMERADEAFLVATSLPVLPVSSVNGKDLRGGAPGPLTARIQRAVAACERGELAAFGSWAVDVA